MLELASKILLCYLIGSIMGSLLVGRLKGGVDIRTMGSGNAGGTNALRTQGVVFALMVIVVDIGKGVIAAAVVPGLSLPGVPADPLLSESTLLLACSAAAVVGHLWPIWHRFRGGKGAATVLGTLIVIVPAMVLPLLLLWAWALALFGYVGLATMVAGAGAPLYMALMHLPHDQDVFFYCLAMSLLLIFSHRSNISRMLKGTESRNKRLMLFRRGRGNSDDGKG